MELYAKGQLSYLILTCLEERDFYGLDIISEISSRSNGAIQLKKPSVYSNLTRMESQGYISSYLKNSDFGPNRKYYSLTEKGRNFFQELKDYFDKNNIDVFKGLLDNDSHSVSISSPVELKEEKSSPILDGKSTEINDDFFDFSSIEKPIETNENEKIKELTTEIAEQSPIEEKVEEKTEKLEVEETEEKITNDYQYIPVDRSNLQFRQVEVAESEEGSTEESKEFIEENVSVDEYNKRLYDISKDINKYKRKRSFAEDQISMTATIPANDSEEKSKAANLQEFKTSFLENKNKYQNQFGNLDFSRYMNANRTYVKEEPKEEPKNDAVFITQRFTESDFERARKIEPPRLRVNHIESEKDSGLPAPKRDLTIDPSHKEILTRLYSKSRDSSNDEVREDALYDFDDLKKYYNNQNISFVEYKKPADKVEHNTNKLYLWVSFISLILSSCVSASIFLILFKTNLLNVKMNFMFILLPALFILDVIWKFYNYRKYKGWLPAQMKPRWQIWLFFLLLSGIIVGLNFICGMSSTNFAVYATALILPLGLIFVQLPIRYYIKRVLLVKYWK